MEQPTTSAAPGESMPPAGNKQQNTAMAVVAYILFFIPLLTDAKNDTYVKYHVKQGFVLFLSWIVVYIINVILPYYFSFIPMILNILLLVLLVVGIINAVNGKKEPLPVIGQLADKFNF